MGQVMGGCIVIIRYMERTAFFPAYMANPVEMGQFTITCSLHCHKMQIDGYCESLNINGFLFNTAHFITSVRICNHIVG